MTFTIVSRGLPKAHQDFSHMEESPSNTTLEASFKPNLFPSFSATTSSASSGKSRKDIKKRLRSKQQRGLSDNSTSPRALAMKHIAMSTTPRIQNPYEEEFIEEIILPREMVIYPKSLVGSNIKGMNYYYWYGGYGACWGFITKDKENNVCQCSKHGTLIGDTFNV